MEPEKIGGKISLDLSIQHKPREKRNDYPCSFCMRFNTTTCTGCKCDTCQVSKESCPQCKNRPNTIIQYQVIHGSPLEGENWEKCDTFTCIRCRGTWKVQWDQLPKYDKCPRCNTVYFLFPCFTGLQKGGLKGAPRSGFNWEKQDVFKCPSCNRYFHVPQTQLPSTRSCECGANYYCTQSTPKKKGLF